MTNPQRETQKTKEREPLIIYASKEVDGYTYRLHPDSRERVLKANPTPRSFPRIFVSYDVGDDYKALRREMRPELVSLLTGLSEEEVRALGGVEFQDPKTEKKLFNWP
jgi:hypothetical protein